MHSNIFQLSDRPISEEYFSCPDDFYDNSGNFADYIGNKYEGEERADKIKWIAAEFPDIFDLDGEVLIYKGLGNFLKEWADKIQEMAKGVTEENILEIRTLSRIKSITEKTHHGISSRFFIENWDGRSNNWNGHAGDCAEFIGWLATLEVGTRIYVGAVIDYHF